MKLEVGKKYVEKNGDIHEYLKTVENAEGQIVHVTYNHTEMYADYFTECSVDRLVKEYTPPRPDAEVLEDLIKVYKFSCGRKMVTGDYESVIKEAEQMLTRMKGE